MTENEIISVIIPIYNALFVKVVVSKTVIDCLGVRVLC